MTLTIGGVDLTPYVAAGGLKISRDDIDGENAGRVIGSATMHRDRLATKESIEVTCRALTQTEAQTVLGKIDAETVTVSYTSPRLGARTGVTMYCSGCSGSFLFRRSNVDYWEGIAFKLVEA